VITLFFFVLTGVITSNLAARTRAQMLIARNRVETTAGLYGLSRELAGTANAEKLLRVSAFHMATMLKAKIVILQDKNGRLQAAAAHPASVAIEPAAEIAAGRLLVDPSPRAPHEAIGPTDGQWLLVPLQSPRGTHGVVGMSRDVPDWRLTPDDRRLFNALVDQTAVAIERVFLAEEIDQARLLSATERLRSALLASISHDLRTPLTSILGALTSLRSFDLHYSQEMREELLNTAQEEAERMTRFVNNLLDITRLESGALVIRLDPVDLIDIVGSALRRGEKILHDHRVKIDLSPNLPMLALDSVLTEQILFNLFDNARKYSAPQTCISVVGREAGGTVVLSVADEGIGIPATDIEKIFEKFHRVQSGDRQRAGTGLGLAICRGFVEAQGGQIVAANRANQKGAVFTVTFPVANATQKNKTPSRPLNEEFTP
jgi:two-component system sensor histidine kinase KdpD